MPELMTDLDNRFWLCEQVIEVRQQGGMSLERALAMLHKLTELETHEPYLTDQKPEPAVSWDYGEPLVDRHVGELYEEPVRCSCDLESGWPDVSPSWGVDFGVPEGDRAVPFLLRADGKVLYPIQEVTFDDGLGPLPTAEEVLEGYRERHCNPCGDVLERRETESKAEFEARESCSKSCAAKLREERKREARQLEVVA